MGEPNDLLLKSAAEGDEETVRLALGGCVNVTNNFGSSPLICAAYAGHATIVDLLLAAGADIEYRSPQGGISALHQATCGGHAEIVKRLLDAGADINGATEHENTPLMMAAAWGDMELVRLLLERGVAINRRDKSGGNAWMIAGEKGEDEIAAYLVERGAETENPRDAGQQLTLALRTRPASCVTRRAVTPT